MKNNEVVCAICGAIISERESCNPWPVVDAEDAACCHACDYRVVIPARLKMLREEMSNNVNE